MSHIYLDNSYTEEQISKMQMTDSPSKIVGDFISMDELKLLRELIETVDRASV